MKKQIVTSLAVIGAVGAVAIGGTMALFTDSETSQGNIFTAGAIDLTVDAGGSYYNGLTCEDGSWTCEPWADQVVSFDQGVRKNGSPVVAARSNPSAILGPAETAGNPSDSGFTEDDFTSLGFYDLGFGGWVILKFDNIAINGPGNDIRVYEVTGGSYPDEKAVVEASQDGVNWVNLGIATRDEDFDLGVLPWAKYVRITDDSNVAGFESTADGFDVDAVKALHCETEPTAQALVNQECDGSWAPTNLDGEQFFNLEDVKPGDSGKTVISFHVENNDSWVCLKPEGLKDVDNDVVDPELELLDNDTTGELSQEIKAVSWNDNDGDGYFEPNLGETLLYSGSAFNLFGINLPVADSSTGTPLTPSTTKWVGLAWCAGSLAVDLAWGNITCDGSTMGNIAQTDSFTADLTAFAVQQRNNGLFVCNEVN